MRGLLFLLLLAFAFAPVAAEAQHLVGTVHDESTGEAIPGAHVLIDGRDGRHGTISGPDGSFRLSGLQQATYRLEVSMLGYTRHSGEVVVSGTETRFDVFLRPAAYDLDEVVVRATRLSVPLWSVSHSVTVLDEAAVRTQQSAGQSLNDILGKTIPGLGVSTGSTSIYGQTLRGRSIAVMIDGVPQSTTRNTSRDFSTLDPSIIERVEVIRGATSLYGDGATGGIINIITRSPLGQSLRTRTDVEAGGSLAALGEGLQGRFSQSVSGSSGRVGYTGGFALQRTSGLYDAEGDLIPPDPYGQGGLAASTSYDVHAKTTYSRGPHRVQILANHYRSEQETDYTTDPSVNQQVPGEAKAVAMEGLQLDRRIGSRNTVASADYWHGGLAGGNLHAQAFFRDYMTRFQPFDGRPWAAYGAIIQSYLESQKAGARLEYERGLPADVQLLIGLDLTAENTQQPVFIIDPDVYDASGGLSFQVAGEQPWVPLMKPRQAGLFGQVSGSPFSWLDLQGGIRYERARLNIDDFTTLAGNDVNGGSLAYDPVLFNAGAVVHTSASTRLFASFSQGFSLTDIGLYLRSAPDGFTVGNRALQAQTVNNVEVGAGVNTRPVRASLSGFYNQSDLGTTSAGLDMAVVRAPERVYGVEATLDLRPNDALRLGSTFTWAEGEHDVNEDGEYLPLNTFRIQPLKLTAYGEYEVSERWTNRLQVLYSGDRTRAYDNRANPEVVLFGERPVESYAVVDFISTVQAGPGMLRLGVENLLNNQYFPVVSQLMYNGGNSSRAAAPGIQLRVGYTVTY